jgi:hypothetical protein
MDPQSLKEGCRVNGTPIAWGVVDGEGDSGIMTETGDSMKSSRDAVALPAKPPQKKFKVRGPGDERNTRTKIAAKPSPSVVAAELWVANDWGIEGDTARLTKLEGTPLAVKTKDEAASYRLESVRRVRIKSQLATGNCTYRQSRRS